MNARKPKQPAKPPTEAGRPSARKPRGDEPSEYWRQTRTIVLTIVAVVGWMCSIWLGILELPEKINSYYAEKDKALANVSPSYDPKRYLGRWTNDPELDVAKNVISERPEPEKNDRGSLQLSIVRDDDGTFFGELISAKILETSLPWTAVVLKGEIGSLGGFKGSILEVRGNEFVSLGNFELAPVAGREGYLEFTASGPAIAVVPQREVLWRTEAVQSGGEPNPKFYGLLRETGAKLLEERKSREAKDEHNAQPSAPRGK